MRLAAPADGVPDQSAISRERDRGMRGARGRCMRQSLLLPMVALVVSPGAASAYTGQANSRGVQLAWSQPVVKVALDPAHGSHDLDASAVRAALAGAADAWSSLPEAQVVLVESLPADADVVLRFRLQGWPYQA